MMAYSSNSIIMQFIQKDIMVGTIKRFGQVTEYVTDLVRSILSVMVKSALSILSPFPIPNCSIATILSDSKC